MFLSKICFSRLREQVLVSSISMVTIVSTLTIETTNQNVCSVLSLMSPNTGYLSEKKTFFNVKHENTRSLGALQDNLENMLLEY